MNIINW